MAEVARDVDAPRLQTLAAVDAGPCRLQRVVALRVAPQRDRAVAKLRELRVRYRRIPIVPTPANNDDQISWPIRVRVGCDNRCAE